MIDLLINGYSYFILAVIAGIFIGTLVTNNKE